MAFYKEIAKYYDYIFPTGIDQICFISEIAGNPPKRLLDIACGTGGYSIELARLGYSVMASDIDATMIDALGMKIKENNLNIDCMKAGMLDLEEKLQEKFNLAFCIGNSIVHLDNKDEVQTFLKSTKKLLEKDGKLILQIINFDRIILRDIKELPVIENEEIGLKFERYYRFDESKRKIYFKTILGVNDSYIKNEIPLYPLRSDDLVEMLKLAGYKKIKVFGDFCGQEFDKYNSFMLVIYAS